MGRFIIRGANALRFVQHVLTNNAEALDLAPTGAQYTLIASETGAAVDDAFLYRFFEGEYLLVVNAANRQKDLAHLQLYLETFGGVELIDCTYDIAMFALQGTKSRWLRSTHGLDAQAKADDAAAKQKKQQEEGQEHRPVQSEAIFRF